MTFLLISWAKQKGLYNVCIFRKLHTLSAVHRKSEESTEKSTPVRQSCQRKRCRAAHCILTKRSAGTSSWWAVTSEQCAKAGTWKGIKWLHHALCLGNLDSPAHAYLESFGELALVELCRSLGERNSQEGMLNYKVEVQDNTGMCIKQTGFHDSWAWKVITQHSDLGTDPFPSQQHIIWWERVLELPPLYHRK